MDFEYKYDKAIALSLRIAFLLTKRMIVLLPQSEFLFWSIYQSLNDYLTKRSAT